ncbi:MAG: HAD family hydrolase, partial [Chloroflexota bacterium]
MAEIKVVSFDVEGTLVTLDFSSCVWYEAIPGVYARKKGLSVDEARQALKEEYDRVGDQRREWYDIHYWFQCFDLGDPGEVLA